ncbi:ankyrin repeat-containing domain protein [Amylocarpus encephaloides]|uniref:Ankyrin repeat-containing domain protein n=1 Tax=Amylocarpus encephaloides TaxID=45428 RepID=A0A9P8C8J2_9HELO|nr:ankyrin repeat-containing domain protein [Amylocarpus encephaloides]
MNPQSITVDKQNSEGEYSFAEALFLGPKESLALVSQAELGLPPTSRSPAAAGSPGPGNELSRQKTTPSRKEPPNQLKSKPSTNMATSKTQAQCLELCHKATTFTDRISVRILEYLTSVNNPADGFERLAHDFLDTSQILFSIEAGLGDCSRSGQKFPLEMLLELNDKFRATHASFQFLFQMLRKLLDQEMGTMGRMKRGWGKMFGDNDIKKMVAALGKTRESLRMSALVFQWSLGSERIEREMGIGYTSLSAALNRMDQKSGHAPVKATTEDNSNYQPPPKLPFIPTESHDALQQQQQQQQQLQPQHQQQQQQQQPQPSLTGSAPWPGRTTSFQQEAPPVRFVDRDSGKALLGSDLRQYSGTTAQTFVSSGSSDHYFSGVPEHFDRVSIIDDVRSHSGTTESESLLGEVEGLEIDPSKAVRLSIDPGHLPRRHPRIHAGPDAGNMKASLFAAIREKNHKLVAQLLDRGASANTGPSLNALKEAILTQDIENVRLLLLFGADPNSPDKDGITPLKASVEKSFLAGATALLKHGADPNLAGGLDLESPLAASVMSNMVGFSHLFLIYNGDANHITMEGNTLLTSAIKKKTPKKFIDLLLKYGSDPNAKNREGKTALFEAITVGRADIVTSLLENGANPNLPGPKHMLWPSTYQSACLQVLLSHGADPKKCPGIMELATSINNTESVRILLKAGVDPNAKKDGVYTPLCTSIRDDRVELFELLLSNGADPNTMASEYPCFKCVTHNRVHYLPALVEAGGNLNSPKGIAEMAVSCNNMEALNWLLDHGVNPNDRNPRGMSALTTAIREDRTEMFELLLLRGADPNVRGEDWPICIAVRHPTILKRILSVLAEPRAYKGVIERAVSANQLESVKLLVAAGVSVEDKNGGVFSPLTTALREDRRGIVSYLLNEGGADVNSPGEHLPIVKALRRYHGEDIEMLELLLDHGADPNKMYRGWNAVMQAIENGDIDVLKLLKKRVGIDLSVKDELGRNVLQIAASRGWDEAVAILKPSGI